MRPIHSPAAVLALAAFSLAAGCAAAQDAGALRQLEAGYDGSRAFETANFNPITRDAQGNRLVVNGVIQDTSGAVAYRSMPASGAAYLLAGAASQEAQASVTAIGNLVSVNIAGNGNTVILNATQTTGGAVSASLNGSSTVAP
jgi:holdfast attachment protein HfaA